MNQANEPAFATAVYSNIGTFHQKGLTKREYFAAMAMQGLISSDLILDKYANRNKSQVKLSMDISYFSCLAADALLNRLETKNE